MIVPGVPLALMLMVLIHRRPNSLAKNFPSYDGGNFTDELSPAL